MRTHFRFALVAVLAAVTLACATDPVRIANTPLQKAYGAMQDYETYQEAGLVFVEDANTPKAVKDALIKAEAAATPLVHPTRVAVQTVERIRAEVKAGTSTQEKLEIATRDLAQWTVNLQKAVDDLVAAIGTAKAGLKPGGGGVVFLLPPRPDTPLPYATQQL